MNNQQSFHLQGTFYECCLTEGHCPIWFGRNRWQDPCTNLATYQIREGHINNVDMKGIIIIYFDDGIGPNYADLAKGNGVQEGAVYISDRTSPEQKQILTQFVTSHLWGTRWSKNLGVKFVNIEVKEKNGSCSIVMPFGEQRITQTIGGDGKTPIRMENPKNKMYSNIKFCNTDLWKYNDFGRNLEFHNTSGVIADFILK
jgi:hypothetical protein